MAPENSMTPRSSQESALLRTAHRRFPGGVLGGYYAPDDLQFVVKEARGAHLFDFSGREYLDYVLGSGPMVLGHAHPAVIAAVEAQLRKGSTYFQLSEPAVALAEEICRAVPCAEQLRYASSGTEATFFALRVARAFRKRDRILKFEGGFHGTHDYSLMSVGPRAPKAFPAPTPDSAGIPHAISDEVLIAPFNDLAETEAILAAHHESLAAVIMEPFQRLVVPDKAFLAGVREVTRRYGVPLIFDEIVTGFRLAYGGAQEYYGVVPDLAAVGKIIGGGFPLAAVVGREEIMRHLAPAMEATGEFVQQAGTLNGNPVAAAAAHSPVAAAATAPPAPSHQQARVLFEGSPSWKAWFWQYVLAWILAIVLVGLVWVLVLHLVRKATKYKVTTASIDTEVGVFSRRIETLQLWRIKDIDFQQSFWERILGVARIFVFTKDVTDPVLTIVGLPGSRDLFDQLKEAIETARQSRNLMGIVE